MSTVAAEEGKKWIQTFLAICSIIGGYVFYLLFLQLDEWFSLEAKIPYFVALAQGLSVVLALVCFLVALKHPKSSRYLHEVYDEKLKVVWMDSQKTTRLTISIVILVVVIGFVLSGFDILGRYVLNLIDLSGS